MRSKRKNDKKSNSKSLEKRSISKRHDINVLLDCELDCGDKSKAFIPDTI